MSVQVITPKIENSNAHKKIQVKQNPYVGLNAPVSKVADKVSFTGSMPAPNPIVWLMDFIATGGYAASFILQDGTGFIAPRIYKGLMRGGKKKLDENGNVILDKKGEPKRELNWAFARKEFLREVITGPSAFVIPMFMLKYITKKFGRANNVKLDYIDGFQKPFIDFVKNNRDAVIEGNADKTKFFKGIFEQAIDYSINSHIPEAEKLGKKEVSTIAESLASKVSEGKISEVVDEFMKLRKSKIGGKVDEMAVDLISSDGKSLKKGVIGELIGAMNDYFDDAVKSVHKSLKKDSTKSIEDVIKNFTNKRMGTRFFTNIGLFLTVAMFFTQIPKLYNMGTGGKNPALANEEDEQPVSQIKSEKTLADSPAEGGKQNVSFGGNLGTVASKTGKAVFNNKTAKFWSDVFEFSGPVIGGNAMAILLYSFCIPPRIANAQDKYDLSEIFVRDLTAFTALLFGAKALARLFSDGFTKLTGLALNNKDLAGRKWYQKAWDYLNPSGKRHSVLSSKQLESKYTHLEDYRDGVVGFFEFIEQSGGNVKKALKRDSKVKAVVDEILQTKGKNFATATVEEIKSALTEAHLNKTDLIKKFYKLFEGPNGLLNKAKTCNSFFDFLSTLVLVPGLIITLTDVCKKMTEDRRAKEKAQALANRNAVLQAPLIPSSRPTMAGFLNNR